MKRSMFGACLCTGTSDHHLVEGVHVALELRWCGVLFLGALFEHMPHAYGVCIAVVQDAGGHFAITASPARLLHAQDQPSSVKYTRAI